jgi:hypothetical protein
MAPIGVIDEVTEGFGNLLFSDFHINFYFTLPICTPSASRKVGPVTVTVDSVCV